jgi:hypothetical protein
MSQHQVAESASVRASGDLGRATPMASNVGRVFHFRRFRAATGVLLALGIASLGVAIGLSTGGRNTPGPGDWSAWQPPDSGLTGAQEIANFVAPYYRASKSEQLTVVTAVNQNDPNHPLQVAVPASGSAGSLVPLPAGDTIVYNLCGVGGQDCSIGVGKPSNARLLLLKREALELALYTFKYISGVHYVVALLPPGHASHGCTGICPEPHSSVKVTPLSLGIFFDNQELKPWLDRPLSSTFPETLPPTVQAMPNSQEAELVSVLAGNGLFQEHVEQGQDGSSVVLLSPLPPQ